MKAAVYAGSFDPPTLGHAWVIEQAAHMFTHLTVAIGVNPEKRYSYDLELRKRWLQNMVGSFSPQDVRVDSFENLFLVDYAKQIGADVIIRGIRNAQDFAAEQAMWRINSDLQSGILTIFLMPPRELAEISSSVVKGMMGPKGWQDVICRYVPENVCSFLIDHNPE